MRKLLDGAIVRMTNRYEEAGAWKRSGAKDFEDDLARKTGTSKSAAKRAARTSKRLKNRPKTDDALRNGKLSPDQADAVTSGADASPEDEDDLLASAETDPLHATRDKAAPGMPVVWNRSMPTPQMSSATCCGAYGKGRGARNETTSFPTRQQRATRRTPTNAYPTAPAIRRCTPTAR